MGEARQRRLAREAGRPWKRDAPPQRVRSLPALPAAEHRGRAWEPSQGSHHSCEPLPWYMDPMCPAPPPRPARAPAPAPEVVVLSEGTSAGLGSVRAALERRAPGRVMFVRPEDAGTVERLRELAEPPARAVPPAWHRPRTMEALLLLAALGLDSPGASIVVPSGRGRR